MRTLVEEAAPIRMFAQDGRHLAWETASGKCDVLIRVRDLARRFETAIACEQWTPSDRQFVLANGHAFWLDSEYGNEQYHYCARAR